MNSIPNANAANPINMNDTYIIGPYVTLASYNLSPNSVIPTFLIASLSYVIILFCNLILMLTIILNKCLHQPMYLILINLPINDLMGSSAFFIQAIKQILWDSQPVSYSACVVQAFFIHIYASGTMFMLTAMAYDRYIAICWPLKYNVVMTNAHIMKIITISWLSCLVLIGVLFGLLLRLPRCRTEISQPYCDNPSLLSLVCENTAINNIYGLLTVALTQVGANGMILYTYLRILIACFRSKHYDTKAKALQTCATHLLVFLLLESLGLFTITSYRLRGIPPHLRRFIGMSTLIFPPTLNPIIYGLKTKEIRVKVVQFFRSQWFRIKHSRNIV
ncbi:olfactory receptor 52Z1P-like [Eucyclogobius newberryi]|uniref:olfactory receptor 52Z1P-like n=1 Tax=Eucyclogobius newberryi TaxID=166745 RepID=UPI003B5A2745